MLNPEFLKNGPGPRLAFLEKPEARLIAEAMVAFANTEGGTIIVGLTMPVPRSAEPIETRANCRASQGRDQPRD